MSQNKVKVREVAKQRKERITQDQLRVYEDILSLVEQALHARIISDVVWKYRWERVARTGFGNSIISFSHIALENFSIQQLWKLFDTKNSVFHVWYVADCLSRPALSEWLEKNIQTIQKDINLISEWRHVMVGHRAEVGYFAPEEYQKKFTDARSSEKRMQGLLLNFLCQIKFETQRIPITQTMEGLQFGLASFEAHIKKEIPSVYKNYESN